MMVKEKKKIKVNMEYPFFFIVGVGRSGTTLLMSMLDAHPEIAMPPESKFLQKYVLPNRKIIPKKALDILKKDQFLNMFPFDVIEYFNLLFKNEKYFSWEKAYLCLLDKYRFQQNKKYIGDKDPKLIEHLPSIYNLFPKTKILHIIRDPRDVFLSRQRAGWSKDKSWFSNMVAYQIQYNLGRINGRKYFHNNYYDVTYEQLVKTPERVLKELMDFLGLSYSSKMINFYNSAESIIGTKEKEWKNNVNKPLLINNFDKWKKELDRNTVIMIEGICDSVFFDELYKKAYTKLSYIERVKIQCIKLISKIVESMYTFILRCRIELSKINKKGYYES